MRVIWRFKYTLLRTSTTRRNFISYKTLTPFPRTWTLWCCTLQRNSQKTPIRNLKNSASTRSQSTQIGLLAYHGRGSGTLHRDYPNTSRADLGPAIKKLIPNRLTLVQGVTGVRNYPEIIYHRCSSSAGSTGGALVNNNGELIGMTPLHELITSNDLGIQVDGEYNGDGVVDSSRENIGIPLDSPVLREFIRDVLLPVVAPECRDAWKALLQD